MTDDKTLLPKADAVTPPETAAMRRAAATGARPEGSVGQTTWGFQILSGLMTYIGSFADARLRRWRVEDRVDRVHDISMLAEELTAARATLAARDRAIALTSHDLRTPLIGISGMVELLGRTPLSAEQESYVQAVRTSVSSLRALVDHMLDAGKIAAGHWQLRPEAVSIEALIEEVVELLAPQAQAKGLEIAAHVATHVPETIRADPNQLLRILSNLVGNAIKFTDSGGVAIEVSAHVVGSGFCKLAIRVRDTGIGISSGDQARIFGEYEQAEPHSIARTGGTGLGLAITRAIARAMGGDITVDSSPAMGSTFCLEVELPILQPARSERPPLQGKRLLLVSRKTLEPAILMRRLYDLGATVELSVSADAARQSLQASGVIDAILLDHGRDFDAAAFTALGTRPLPPAVVLIAPADRADLPRLRASGLNAHLVKPMRTASLVKVVSALAMGEPIPSTPATGQSESPGELSGALRVLIADDNQINTVLGTSLLQSLGHAVETAENGALALARAVESAERDQPFDVILMDLHMPVLDGFEAIAAIRNAEQIHGYRSLIVALTADMTAEAAEKAAGVGADATLTKPIDRTRLAALLTAHQAFGTDRCHEIVAKI